MVKAIDGSYGSSQYAEKYSGLKKADGNLSLSKDEFFKTLISKGITDTKVQNEIFSKVDTDGNDQISPDELTSGLKSINAEQNPNPINSLKSILGELGKSLIPSQLKTVFDLLKTGRENQITESERSRFQPVIDIMKNNMTSSGINGVSLKGLLFDTSI